MFRKTISVLMMLAIIFTTLTFSSCGEIESKNPKRPDFVPGIGESYSDLYSDTYTKIAENNDMQLLFNYDTTDIRLVNKKTKFVWDSAQKVDGEWYRGQAFILQYTDKAGAEQEMTSEQDSINEGKFKITNIENGVEIFYGVGDIGYVINYPMALSVDRFNAYVNAFGGPDSDIAYTLADLYTLYDFTTEEARAQYDSESLPLMMKSFKKAKKQPWYYMNGNMIDFDTVQTLNNIFAMAGYSEADYELDNEGIDVPESSPVEFSLKIRYELTENGLQVTIPEKDIYYNKEYVLENIAVLPYLMDYDNSAEGYFLLPDGSGSIMNFNNGKEKIRDKSVYVQMYGVDNSRVVDEKMAYYNDAVFPVFGTCVKGISKSKTANFAEKDYNGLFGIIECGETFAGLEAVNYDKEASKHNNLKLEFRVNERVRMDSFTASGDTDSDSKYCKYQFQRYLGDIKFNLNVLSGSDATYSGMANYYSNYLFGDNANTTAKDYYSTVETVGVINTVEKFFGIDYNSKEILTDFTQISKIASELQQNGFNNMNIKMSGWCNGGYEHSMFKKGIKIEKDLGKQDDLVNLYKTLQDKGVGLYPDVDIQNSYCSEGEPDEDYLAAQLNGSNSVISSYSPVDFRAENKLSKYALNFDGLTKNFTGFLKDYKEYGFGNVSYRSIGSEITSNYKDDETYMERQETLEKLIEFVKTTKDEGYNIMGTAGQAAFVKYLSVINELPVESSRFDKCDYSVPFTAMVLSGHVDYTYKPINLSNNNRKDLLMLIESGAGAYYKITGTKYDKLTNTSYDSLYSTVYSEIKDSIFESYDYVSTALDGVYGLKIAKHEQIAEDVYKTTYENGTSIFVNYSDEDYSAQGIKIAAQDYLKVKGGAE